VAKKGDKGDSQVPEGAAVFPIIPAELGVHPLLLAVLHAVVFLSGSADDVVDEAAAAEALEYLTTYLQRLAGPDLQRLREDLDALTRYARQQKWPKGAVHFLTTFQSEHGIGERDEA
jgi:hypothetical protein